MHSILPKLLTSPLNNIRVIWALGGYVIDDKRWLFTLRPPCIIGWRIKGCRHLSMWLKRCGHPDGCIHPLNCDGRMVDTAPLCTPLDRYINEKGHLFQAGKWVYNPNISYQISMHIKCACLPQCVCLYVYVSVWNIYAKIAIYYLNFLF